MRMLSIGRTDNGYIIVDAGGEGIVGASGGVEYGQGDMSDAKSESELRSILKIKYRLSDRAIDAAVEDLKKPDGNTAIPL